MLKGVNDEISAGTGGKLAGPSFGSTSFQADGELALPGAPTAQ